MYSKILLNDHRMLFSNISLLFLRLAEGPFVCLLSTIFSNSSKEQDPVVFYSGYGLVSSSDGMALSVTSFVVGVMGSASRFTNGSLLVISLGTSISIGIGVSSNHKLEKFFILSIRLYSCSSGT